MTPSRNSQLREWIPPFRLPEKVFAGAMVLWIASWLSSSLALQLLTWGLAMMAAMVVAFRVSRFYISRLIWRLRNRLLVAFLFIAVIPISLVLILAAFSFYAISGQVALYLVSSRLNDRLQSIDTFPGAQTIIETTGTPRAGSGFTLRKGVLHAWIRRVEPNRRVTVLAPLTRSFFTELDPDFGSVSLTSQGDPGFQLPDDVSSATSHAASVPPSVNSFDAEVRWGAPMVVRDWDTPSRSSAALLLVRTRLSTLLTRLLSPGIDSGGGLVVALYFIGALVLIAEIISLFIGISISRTMTAAVHNLYDGTQRVMLGDFSHRIPVTGNEQIADLSRSFNSMTENVERLLIVSKESERMQAELEIARRVQQQLFPSDIPHSDSLDIRAVCQPARQVSGDYYDYQALGSNGTGSGKLVLALGDVAGKGISAALLMASLQSTLRVQLREWQTNVSTERLVTGLNHHLFLNTTPEKYATFFLAIYDEATGMLEYTNAGHLPPLLIRAGKTTALDSNGMVVGAFAGAKYDSSHLQLEPGDLLVCYTDGVTELENEFEEQFGEDRLSEVLLRCKNASLGEVEAAILDAATKFSGSPEAQDDLTMLMVRRK